MLKIWAKIEQEHNIVATFVLERFENFKPESFFEYISEICENLNLSTPIVLKKHFDHFNKFNVVVFKPMDFVENVDFDRLILENIFR